MIPHLLLKIPDFVFVYRALVPFLFKCFNFARLVNVTPQINYAQQAQRLIFAGVRRTTFQNRLPRPKPEKKLKDGTKLRRVLSSLLQVFYAEK